MFAYVDPGTGLLLWQAIVSAFVGAFFYVKKSRAWFLKTCHRLLPIARPIDPPGKVEIAEPKRLAADEPQLRR